jgi:hypothetical protein
MNAIVVDPQTGKPVYHMARAAWVGPSALRTAAEQGTRAFNERPEAILRRIASLNDSERDACVIGAQQAIREKLARIRDGRDASGVAGLSEQSRAQLDAILTAVDDDPAVRTQIANRLSPTSSGRTRSP